MNVPFVTAEEVRRYLTVDECRMAVRQALADYSEGCVKQPLRTFLDTGPKGRLGVMPAALANGISGVKTITLFPNNTRTGLPSHQGVITLFGRDHGELTAVVEAGSVTELRTAAASAVATELLARADATTLALLGAGAQAAVHFEAIRAVRPIRRVLIWNRSQSRARLLGDSLRQSGVEVEVVSTAQEAITSADILCTLTASPEPIVQGEWLRPGTHINAVGSYQPHTRELDTRTVVRSKVWVDSLEAATREAGEIVIPIQAGEYHLDSLQGELGHLVLDGSAGRMAAEEITLFKSLGMAVEDVAAASRLLELMPPVHSA